jgi:cytochrome oxidase Cu insertion factor (SCO1/SenC/PrrC family)
MSTRSVARIATVVLMLAVMVVAPAVVYAAPAAAPAFSLELFNGKTLTLADLKGRPVVLLFWAEW